MTTLREKVQELAVNVAHLEEALRGLDRLTDEKFVKFGTMLAAEAQRVALALDAASRAVDKAEVSVNERLAAMNEFRGALTDQASSFIPRNEAENRLASITERIETQREAVALADQKLDDRIKLLEQGASNMQGRFAMMGAVITGVVVVVNIAIALLAR